MNSSILSYNILLDDRAFIRYLLINSSYNKMLNVVFPVINVCPLKQAEFFPGYCDIEIL